MKPIKYFPINYEILLILCVVSLVITQQSCAYDLKEYFPLGLGDSWVYTVSEDGSSSTRIYLINGREIFDNIDTAVMMDSGKGYSCFAIDSEGVKWYKYNKKESYGLFKPPLLIFPFLEVGKEQKLATTIEKYRMDGQKKESTGVVERISLESTNEELEVPAGRFNDCLKYSVVIDAQSFEGGSSTHNCTSWLAPGVGKIKQICYTREFNSDGQRKDASTEIFELSSAVINGKSIGINSK